MTNRPLAELRAREAHADEEIAPLVRAPLNTGALALADLVRRFDEVIARYGDDEWDPTRVLVGRARLRRCLVLSRLDEDERALAALSELAEQYLGAAFGDLAEVGADALRARALLRHALGSTLEAVADLRRVIAVSATAAHPGIRHTNALAQRDLISWEQRQAHADGAAGLWRVIAACEDLIDAHVDSPYPSEAWNVLSAARTKAATLAELATLEPDAEPEPAPDRPDLVDPAPLADELAERMWQRYAGVEDVEVRDQVARLQLDRMNDWPEPPRVLAAADRLLDWIARAPDPLLHRAMGFAWRYRAWAQRALGDPRGALATLADLDSHLGTLDDPELLTTTLGATLDRGRILRQLNRGHEALDELLSTQSHLDRGGAGEDVRVLVAQCLDLVADLCADATPPAPEDPQDGRQGLDVDAAVDRSQRPLEETEVAYAAAVDRLVRRFADDPSPRVRAVVVRALSDLGVHQRDRRHFDAALTTYERLHGLYPEPGDPRTEEMLAQARLNTGFLLLILLQRPQEALAVYDEMFTRFAGTVTPAMRDTLAKASASRLACLNQLTHAGESVGYGAEESVTAAELDELEAWKQQAIGAGDDHAAALAPLDAILTGRLDSLHPELRRRCLDALVRKAHHLAQLGRLEEALATNDEAIARYGNDLSTTSEKDVALALANRAVNLDKLGRHEEELATYDQLIARWADSSIHELRRRAAYAQFARAVTLVDLGRPAEAEAGYRAGAGRYLDDSVPTVRLQGARSAANLAALCRDQGRHTEAAAWFEQVLRACAGQDDPGLRKQEASARRGLQRARAALGQVEPTVLRPWPVRVWVAPAGLAGLILLALYLFGLFALGMGVSRLGVDGVVAALASDDFRPIALGIAVLLAASVALRIALTLRCRIEIGSDTLVEQGLLRRRTFTREGVERVSVIFALAAVGRRVSVRQEGRTREIGMELYRAGDADLVASFFTGG